MRRRRRLVVATHQCRVVERRLLSERRGGGGQTRERRRRRRRGWRVEAGVVEGRRRRGRRGGGVGRRVGVGPRSNERPRLRVVDPAVMVQRRAGHPRLRPVLASLFRPRRLRSLSLSFSDRVRVYPGEPVAFVLFFSLILVGSQCRGPGGRTGTAEAGSSLPLDQAAVESLPLALLLVSDARARGEALQIAEEALPLAPGAGGQ